MNLDKPKTRANDDAKTAARKRLAGACQTTVIGQLHASSARASTLAGLIKESGRDGRFDLLTVPDLSVLATPAGHDLLAQLVGEALMALDLHAGERILIAADGDPEPAVRAFRARFAEAVKLYPKPMSADTPIQGVDLRKAGVRTGPPSSALAVCCMDFRQHDDDLSGKLRSAFDLNVHPAVYAMAGGAKDIEGTTRRSRLAIEEIERYSRTADLRQIVLTCHTDCGAFGGDKAFENRQQQKNELRYRLRVAAETIGKRFPAVEVQTGIVRLKQGGIDAVLPVRLNR